MPPPSESNWHFQPRPDFEPEVADGNELTAITQEIPIAQDALEFARLFECELKQEVMREAARRNELNDGNMQDGFCLAHIDDGWVSYKGMSWGFVVHSEPIAVDMTFGPDWPFVGFRTVLQPQLNEGKVIWTERNSMAIGTVCWSAQDVAQFGLQKLTERAEKAA